MKKNNKGFTLVELIVVLVILAILAAILVPALLGWIDKAREKSVTTNAEAAYVATQGLVTEKYGSYGNPSKASIGGETAVNKLADIQESFTISYSCVSAYKSATPTKNMYKIKSFTYTPNKGTKKATWTNTTGEWTVVDK